ncbi:DNA polymerase III subunit gamma/tau [Candidatus Poribacteria bacterium]|nr:DNA polymerase III subunit gamma/tau [Candidatus Poribacteria bacterium]
MSYKVIARRWRPTDFDGIIGQEHITRTLKNAIKQNRIAHAYLFSGPRGIGKTSTARVLAKALNCENGPTENPCQKCAACQEITDGYSLDVIEIDGASNTSVEDVRTLRENVKFSPTRGRYKVYIIDEVHMLSKSAFNALLKTLEEPPSHVIFIFATTELHKIPLTVISRCQRFEFKKISFPLIVDILKKIALAENINIEPQALSLIAKSAEGSLRDAETLLDQVLASFKSDVTQQDIIDLFGINRQEIFFNFMDFAANNDLSGMINTIDELVKKGTDLEQFLKGLLEHSRNLIITQTTNFPENILDLSGSDIVLLKEQAKKFSTEDLIAITHIISSCEAQLYSHSSTRYQLEFMCLKISTYGKALNLTDLAQKINSLGERISHGSSIQKKNNESENKLNEETNVAKTELCIPEDPAQIIKKLEEEAKLNKKTTLASCLFGIHEIKLENNLCTFFLDEEMAFFKTNIENKDNKLFLEKTLSDILKHPMKLKITMIKTPAHNKALNKIIANAPAVPKVAIIEKAMHVFEGRVVTSKGNNGNNDPN